MKKAMVRRKQRKLSSDSDSVIAAFSEEQVARLTDLTVSRLRYWDRTGFFKPAYVADNQRLPYSRIYSFKDVASLRTISEIRNKRNVPLQHLRKVAARLRHLKDDLWTKTVLYVLNRKVVFHEPGTELPREVVSGQYVFSDIRLQRIVGDTHAAIEKMKHRDEAKIGQVSRSRFVSHNAWVIAGTRIPTGAIRRFKEAGYTEAEIVKEYPDLTLVDVRAAIAHEENLGAAA